MTDTQREYTACTLEELFKLGDVSLFNLGPNWVTITFWAGPPGTGAAGHAGWGRYNGAGETITAAIASLNLAGVDLAGRKDTSP